MDWLFENETGICHVRVTGVLLKDHKLLVQKIKDQNEYALPGGHLQFGETLEEALVREYQEEIGAEIKCKRLLWTEENFWKWKGKDAHNIGFYYLIDLCEGAIIPDGFTPMRDNGSVVLGWVSIDDLEDKNIFPEFLKSEIKNLSDSPKHFVTRTSPVSA